jgi:hypothetical protein
VRQLIVGLARQAERRENAPYRVDRYAVPFVGMVDPLHRYPGMARKLTDGRIVHCGPESATVE